MSTYAIEVQKGDNMKQRGWWLRHDLWFFILRDEQGEVRATGGASDETSCLRMADSARARLEKKA